MSNPEPDEAIAQDGQNASADASDRSLLRRLQGGHSDASTELYVRYAKRLMALAMSQSSPELAQRVDPEDIVQSVFRTFFRRASLGHYTVPDGEEIWKLLLVIALNKVRATGAFHRAAKRDVRRTTAGASYERAIETKPGLGDDALSVLRMVIEDLLQDLPQLSRRVVELRIKGHELAEISTLLNRSKRTVERVLQEFRQRLDDLIGEDP